MRSPLICLLFVLFVLAPSRAGAETSAVIVVGKADAHAREVAARSASAVLAKADWKLLDKPLSASDTAAISRCFTRGEPQRCILRVGQGKGIANVAYVSVDPDPTKGERGLKLTGRMITSRLDLVMIATRFCDHCADDTLASAAADLVKSLLDRVALTSGRTVLSVKSSPQGARFAVDGTLVGVTDAAIDVTPGPHTVTMELDGYETFARTVDAIEGKTAEVTAVFRRPGSDARAASTITSPDHASRLDASPPNRPSDPPGGPSDAPGGQGDAPRRSRIAKPLLAIGCLAVLGGGIALALDEDSRTSPPGTEQREGYYDTARPALLTIAGGAVLAGIGGYLHWNSSRSGASAAVRPTRGGAMMTLGTSF